MFWMMAGILAFLWLLGLVISCTKGEVHSPPIAGRSYPGAHRNHGSNC
jgi:hypothetical protein